MSGAVLAQVVPPTARLGHLGSAASTVALAGLPTVVTVLRGGTDLRAAVVLLTLGGGASVAWAAEDGVDDLLAAAPVSAPVRSALRTLAVVVVAGLVGSGILLVAAIGPGLPDDLPDRLPELTAAAAISLAVALGAAQRGDRTPAIDGVVAGLVLPGLVAALAVRWPAALPTFASGPRHACWWLVAVVAALAVVRFGRDPARR